MSFLSFNARKFWASFVVFALLLPFASPLAQAKNTYVLEHSKISELEGGLHGDWTPISNFGDSVASLGDFDGDTVTDYIVGAPSDNEDTGEHVGAVWILLMNADETVKSKHKISELQGGFTGDLEANGEFGSSVTSLGDLDDDGITDIAVGNSGENQQNGAVWIIFLNADGTVKGQQRINATEGGFTGLLGFGSYFGRSVLALDDYNNDGNTDLSVGGVGKVWQLHLNNDGTVIAHTLMSEAVAPFTGENIAYFGYSLASLGHVDADGVLDLAVGGAARSPGYVYNVLMNEDGTASSYIEISEGGLGGFNGDLDAGDLFGTSMANVGDLDANGTDDLAVGAAGDDDTGAGAVWILFMDSNGLVIDQQKISDLEGGFNGDLDLFDSFGTAVASMGDADGDGVTDILVGATGDDDGIEASGALWVLYLNADGTVKDHAKISMTSGNLVQNTLEEGASFPSSLAALGQIDGGTMTVVAAGEAGFNGGSVSEGAVFILYLNADGTIHHKTKITEGEGGFTGTLGALDEFGLSVASLGDLDGNGTTELAVGAISDDEANDAGMIWMLSIDNNSGVVLDAHPINSSFGGFGGLLDDFDYFGASLANIGDLDNDGVTDLAVGAIGEDESKGAVWILFMNSDGTVKSEQEISSDAGGFTGTLESNDLLGSAIASLGDLDGDGVTDLAVGAATDGDVGINKGAVWILFLNSDGTVKAQQKINETEGGFTGDLDFNGEFGTTLAAADDLNGDGTPDLFVGAPYDDDGALNMGAFYILYLNADGTVLRHQKISGIEGGLTADLDYYDQFGAVIANLGITGSGEPLIMVGTPGDDDGGTESFDNPLGEDTQGSNFGAAYLLSMAPDTDEDTVLDANDVDDENDGIPDSSEPDGMDGDEIISSLDFDSDGDGLLDALEANGGALPLNMELTGAYSSAYVIANDTDGDGLANDVDSSNGGTPLALADSDLDGPSDYADIDADADGITDATEGLTDTDADLIPDYLDTDSDNDGLSDLIEGNDDDLDGITDIAPELQDEDNDGLDDSVDSYSLQGDDVADVGNATASSAVLQDRDGDSIPDWRDNFDDSVVVAPTSGGGGGGGGGSGGGSTTSTNPGTSDEDDEVILTEEGEMPFTDVIGHWAEEYITELWILGVVEGRTETLFFPDEKLNRAEAAKIVALLFGYEVEDSVTVTSYPDVAADQWYAPYIEALSGEGVLEGYADGTFKPEQLVTRAEALKMALYAAGLTIPEVEEDAELPFTDLYGYEWYVDVVVYGVSLGVTEGYEDDTFRPNHEVTRAEASKFSLKTYEL